MANKALKSIKFPGLSDTYTIPQVDNTLAVSGAAADAKKTGDAIGDLKSALQVTEETIASSVADTTGTSISPQKRVRLNATPIPSGSLIGSVKMIPYAGSGTASGTFELCTLSNGTYTSYSSKTFSINPTQVTVLQDVVNINQFTIGETYVFIVLNDGSTRFRANSKSGSAMVVGDDIASTSFTTRNVNNYELAYSLAYTYSELYEDIGELQQITSDISTIRANANKVNNYPFATQAELKVNNIDFSGLKTAIKDIRLFGADLNDTYWIYTYLVNFGDAGTYSIEIRRESDNKNVCGFSLTSVDSGYKRYRLNEQSNSGITGEVVWNPAAFTTSYYFSQTAYTQIARECLIAKDVFDMKYLIENVLCIGDSLTQGYIKPSGGSYYHTQDSYPSILKKVCNADTVTNRGASGFAASNYYSQNIVRHPDWFVWADYDFVIVWLGTNNGLDTQEQQEAYNNIISAIQTGNANAKIFLCTCFSTTGSSLADTNAFIRAKNLPVIDMNVAPFNLTSDANIHPDDVTHFGDAGYTMVAEYIVSEICKYINTHLSEYNHIGRPVT